MTPIIRSLLDTDLYKFTMWQALLHSHPANHAVYRFVCRNKPLYALGSLAREVEEELDHLCTLRFTPAELEYLAGFSFFKPDFIEFLRLFHFQREHIRVCKKGRDLLIEARGPQVHVMGFEIYVLSIVNELYFRKFDSDKAAAAGHRALIDKIDLVRNMRERHKTLGPRHPFLLFDFGTRRRFSQYWHEQVINTLVQELPWCFKGTSNVSLAMQYRLTPIGTMAHEYLQTFQTVGVQLKDFQKAALDAWAREYRGDLGIALTDTVGMAAFLRDFDLYFAKLFDGLRHDSGDPIEWGEAALAHYARLKIDPHTKRLVFSDGLDVPRAIALYEYFADRVQTGFGIGTNLTNDCGHEPLNIVMKLVECNGQPVAKLSDSPGKSMCVDGTFLAYLRQVFDQAA